MKISKRPKIKLDLKPIDKILEILALVFLITIWIYTYINFKSYPEGIPTHFNIQGTIDKYGNKNDIWQLPIVITVIYLSISFLNKFPQVFNYPVEISDENAESNYSAATTTLRIVKCVCALIFMMIIYSSSNNQNLNILFIPILLILFLSPIAFYLFNNNKNIKT